MAWILIAADGSDGSATAVRLAASIAWPAGTMIGVVTVVPPAAELVGMPYVPIIPTNGEALEQSELRRAQEVTWHAVDELRAAGCSAHCKVMRGRPADVIVSLATRYRADLVMMGSRGLGTFEAALVGSVSSEVVDRAPCPVLIARTDRLGPTLIADDGSPQAAAARTWVAQRPHLLGTSVQLVGVAPGTTFWPDSFATLDAASVDVVVDAQDAVRTALAELLATNAGSLASSGIPVTTAVREGNAIHELVEAAGELQAALLVAGSHGRHGIRRAVLGSVSRGLIHHAHSSVLIVPFREVGTRTHVAQAVAA